MGFWINPVQGAKLNCILQLAPNIWAWILFKQCSTEEPARFFYAVWILTFIEAMTKLFVKYMLCCIWQHEWEAELSDQGWTSHLTSNMKGKIGHYKGCIQTTKHKSTFAYSLHKWILNSGLQWLLKWYYTVLFWEIEALNTTQSFSNNAFLCPTVRIGKKFNPNAMKG